MKIWVRAPVAPAHEAPFTAALAALGADRLRTPVPEGHAAVASPAAIALAPAGAALWLRPYECGGPIGETTALVLIRAAAASGRPWVCEGLGVRAAAAAVVCGAAGVVVDTPLWCTRESALSAADRTKLAEAGAADSVVTGWLAGALERRVTRGPWALAAPQTVADAAPGLDRPALDVLRDWLEDLRARIAEARGPLPRRLVCGPMANVTEGTGLPALLAARGVLPFLALGALRPQVAAERLAAWGALGTYGAGLIGFEGLPHRDAHVRALLEAAVRPSAVTVAGGSVALARRLAEAGLTPWLHTPTAATLVAAREAGVSTAILEGHEAGGHVGRQSSAGLWEEGLAALEDRPDRGTLVLAGAIGDAVSAAFASAMAARFVARGGALTLQAGTAFLLTHEAADHGHVTPLYQAEALRASTTVLVGASVNLPLRCTPNPFTEEALGIEAAMEAEGVPRGQRRARLEATNLGRTRLAAQGVERDPSWTEGSPAPRLRPVPALRQRAEGAFSVGQGAAVTHRLSTVDALLQALGPQADALRAGLPKRAAFPAPRAVSGGPSFRPAGRRAAAPSSGDDIAVVGLGCVLPGALDVPAYWRALLAGRSAIGLVPPERWSLDRYHDPAASTTGPARSASRLAGTVRGFRFDPLRFRIPPGVVPTIDPSQRFALVAAAEAVAMAGWDRGPLDRRRAAVVLGNAMGGEFSKSLALRVRFREVLDAVARDPLAGGWSVEDLRALEARVEAELAPRLPPIEIDSMAGLLSNVVAGRVAAWLDWMGGNLTVDAACAASLASVAVAVDWLRAGRCDAVLAGGVDTDLLPETFVGFTRTEALSRTGSQPFSVHADGFVMGEGAGVLALERLPDALRAGRRVLAVIRGVGQASDGRGKSLTAPRPEGQALALERAWAASGLAPEDVGFVEAHGTGTERGDQTEVAVLARHFAEARTPTWLGSVKGQLGHLKAAAGAAALVKATLALAAGVVPPTVDAGPVHPELPLTDGALRLPRLAVPLPRPVAAVSAFGFGGTDFHVVLAAGPGGDPHAAATARAAVGRGPALDRAWGRTDTTPALTAFGADSHEALCRAVDAGGALTPADAAARPFRAVALGAPHEDVRGRVLAALRGAPDRAVFLGEGLPAAVHLLFPGQGAQEQADDRALRRVPEALACWSTLADRLPPGVWAEAQAGEPVAVHALGYALGVAAAQAFQAAGVPVASATGHSLGAFGAAVAAGVWTVEEALPAVLARGRALAACPDGRMVALRASEAEALAFTAHTPLTLAAINADDQVVMCGEPDDVEAFAQAMGPARARLLAVRRAYHGPSVAPAAEALAEALAALPAPRAPAFPLVSTRTGAPVAPGALVADLVAAVTAPVRFADALRALPPGVGVDVGPGETLARLAERSGRPAAALHGADGPARVAALLLAAGHPGFAEALPRTAVAITLPATPSAVRLAVADLAADVVAPVAAPVPAAPEPVAGDVRSAVVAVVCQVSGYPPESVTEGLDLEGDLGIDSIRKMEILGALEARFGFSTPESEWSVLADADLGALVAHVERHRGTVEAAPTPVSAPAVWLTVPRTPIPDPIGSNEASPGEGAAFDLAAALDALAADPGGTPTADPQPSPIALSRARAAWSRSWAREVGRAPLPPEPVVAFAPDRVRGLPERPVVLATGGLRGILGPCLEALADLSPRVVLLHRSGEAPPGAVSVRGDVGDPADVARAVAAALAAFGRIDLVVHAAGVLRDGPAASRTPADRRAVLRPKWEGAHNLLAATAALPLHGFVTFSSVAARTGNAGQTDYSAANAAMETLRHPLAPTLHVAWTAWADRGMAADPALARLLRARGLVPLPVAEGARTFRALLEAGTEGVVHVSAQPVEAEPLPWPLGALRSRAGASGSAHVPLDPEAPWLADHRVAGRPLVPAGVWVEALLAVAPGAALNGFGVHTPTFVDRPRADVWVAWSPGRAEIVAGGAVVASATLGPRAEGPPRAAPAAAEPAGSEPAAPWYVPDRLFHGPSWRLLDRLDLGGDTVGAALLPRATTVAHAVDAVHQLLAAAASRHHGWLGLPVGAAGWSTHAGGAPVRLSATPRTRGDTLTADVVALDAEGRVVLRGAEVRIRAARPGAADA